MVSTDVELPKFFKFCYRIVREFCEHISRDIKTKQIFSISQVVITYLRSELNQVDIFDFVAL